MHIDHILSNIEKNHFFESSMDYFSKLRLIPIIGLSSGFAIDIDEMIRGNVKAPLVTALFCIDINSIISLD